MKKTKQIDELSELSRLVTEHANRVGLNTNGKTPIGCFQDLKIWMRADRAKTETRIEALEQEVNRLKVSESSELEQRNNRLASQKELTRLARAQDLGHEAEAAVKPQRNHETRELARAP